MKFSIFLWIYFVIFEHRCCYYYYRTLASDTNNVSLMNTSTKITTNRISYTKSVILLSICILSSIILCLYAIFHNQRSTIQRKESTKNDKEDDSLTMSDSSESEASVSIQPTNSNSSNDSF
jgi:hypothetical protein